MRGAIRLHGGRQDHSAETFARLTFAGEKALVDEILINQAGGNGKTFHCGYKS